MRRYSVTYSVNAAQIRAIDVVCEISGSPRLNIMGVCGGGLSVAAMLGYQAAQGDARVKSATFLVTMLDSGQPSLLGAISNDRGQRQLRDRARREEILYGHELLNSFAWLRPNDLIFNYMINNWMLGEEPPAFDVLAWNADCTNATYAFVADACEALYGEKRLAQPGQLEVGGVAIDLGKVTCDTFHVAGATDHISAWRACYVSSQLLGGPSEVVVTSSGHVQSIVCPPDKKRARFHAGPGTADDPDGWLESAQEHDGSWWPHWTDWLVARSGGRIDAPATWAVRIMPRPNRRPAATPAADEPCSERWSHPVRQRRAPRGIRIAVTRQGDQSVAAVARSSGVSASCLARWLRFDEPVRLLCREGAGSSP